jgi:hypothetical protein
MANKRITDFLSSASGTPLGGSRQQPFIMESPLVMMFQGPDKNVTCHIHPGDLTHKHYGILICGLVRHVAKAFKVSEDEVWEWVDKERRRPTSEVTTAS